MQRLVLLGVCLYYLKECPQLEASQSKRQSPIESVIETNIPLELLDFGNLHNIAEGILTKSKDLIQNGQSFDVIIEYSPTGQQPELGHLHEFPPQSGGRPPQRGGPPPHFGGPPRQFGGPHPQFGSPLLQFGARPPQRGGPPPEFGGPPSRFKNRRPGWFVPSDFLGFKVMEGPSGPPPGQFNPHRQGYRPQHNHHGNGNENKRHEFSPKSGDHTENKNSDDESQISGYIDGNFPVILLDIENEVRR